MELDAIGKEVINAFNAKDLDGLLGLFHEKGTYEFPGIPTLQNKEKIGKFLGMVFKEALPDMVITVRETLVCGQHVVIEWTNKATTPKGNPYANQGVFIFRVKDGKIESFREYLDLGPTQQVAKELRT